jgi:hypothetical protein
MFQLLVLWTALAAGDEWAAPPPPQPPPELKAPDLSPKARYETALKYLGANRPGDASAILDLLIAEFPRVPEYFAARAQAQLAMKVPTYAVADAQYALAIKPELISTRFTLAAAEEALGHAASAAYHYRLYADSTSLDARDDLRAEAQRRATRLAPPPAPTAPPPPQPQYQQPQYQPQPQYQQPLPAPRAQTQAPTCRMGSNGAQACGYNCRMGSDGVMACADTPDGVCAMGSDGRVNCSRVGGSGVVGGPPPECRMGTDGRQVCGHNCRMGTNGRMYCASRPDGQCAMNTDGTFTCP